MRAKWAILWLLLGLIGTVEAEVYRYRVQLEVMRQGQELVDQRSFWVQEMVPRSLELEGLPRSTSVTVSVSREVASENLVVYFQVVAPPEADYRELSNPRLAMSPDSLPPAFCFSLQGLVYRLTVTSLKIQLIE
jgi:hypothetical protein